MTDMIKSSYMLKKHLQYGAKKASPSEAAVNWLCMWLKALISAKAKN